MNLPTSGSLTNIEVLEKHLETLPGGSKSKEEVKAAEEVEVVEGKLEEAIRQKRKVCLLLCRN
jgi:hypothetical protein